MNRHVAMIHTVPALADRFHTMIGDRFGAEDRPRIDHVVDPWLLAEAIRSGVTDEVADRVSAHAAYLASQGAELVMITCSSIGGTAALAAERSGVRVLRVDAPMAAEAVRLAAGGTIAVLATLTSTLEPTAELVRASAGVGAEPDIRAVLVEGAAAAKSAGDAGRHDELIRAAVADAARDSAVVVLAQASMAAALEGMETSVPVLSSPESGVDSVVDALRE
jgi:hypothetical protein